MTSEHHFLVQIFAPDGLAGIEPYLPMSLIPLQPHFTNATKQVILVMASDDDDIEFEMDGSLTQTMVGSGFIVGTFEEAVSRIDSLSRALQAADFPHSIGVDDALSGRSASFDYRCLTKITEWM
jgi:hypothetical protein